MRGERKHAGGPAAKPADNHRPNGELDTPGRFTDDWIAEIHRLWAHGAASTFDLAGAVFRARGSLARGEWAALWQPGVMPFSKRKAEMLAIPGQGLAGLNAQPFAHLPRGWSLFYLLAELELKLLMREIQSGVIHPKLTLKQTKELVARLQGGKRTRKEARSFHVQSRLRHFKTFVQTTCGEWSRAERVHVTKALAEWLELLGENGARLTLRIAPTVAPQPLSDGGINRLLVLPPNGRTHHSHQTIC